MILSYPYWEQYVTVCGVYKPAWQLPSSPLCSKQKYFALFLPQLLVSLAATVVDDNYSNCWPTLPCRSFIFPPQQQRTPSECLRIDAAIIIKVGQQYNVGLLPFHRITGADGQLCYELQLHVQKIWIGRFTKQGRLEQKGLFQFLTDTRKGPVEFIVKSGCNPFSSVGQC